MQHFALLKRNLHERSLQLILTIDKNEGDSVMNLNKLTRIACTATVLTGILSSVALAQREPPDRQQQRQERRERIEQMTPEQRQQYFQQRQAERVKNMTTEQRQRYDQRMQQMQQMRRQQQIASVSADDRQRYLMQSAGVTDATAQDAIIAFVLAQTEKRQTVTEAARQLSNLMADANSTPEAISTQLETLRTASKEFRTWKEGALKELDAKIGYTKDSRLQSLLVLVGIIGDESTDAGGFNAIFPKGVAGQGDIIDLLPEDQRNQGGWGGMGGGPGGPPAGGDAPAGGDNPAPAEGVAAPPAQ
jgi:hypothetical protein